MANTATNTPVTPTVANTPVTPTATTTLPANNRVYVPLIMMAGESAAIQRLESESGAKLAQQYGQISPQ